MDDLDELITGARAAARGPRARDVEIGRLEGLLETGSARLVPRPGESPLHHAGYLVGHLIRWLHAYGKPIEASMMLTAAVYGASIADEGGQRQLAKPDRPMTAHSYAAIRTEKQARAALDVADERMLFGWLREQAGIPATPELMARFERRRAARLERTGLRQTARYGREVGEYRAVPTGSVGVEKILNIDGHTVGYIEQASSEQAPLWLVKFGPDAGEPEPFPDYDSALQKVMTHADEHPDFRIDE